MVDVSMCRREDEERGKDEIMNVSLCVWVCVVGEEMRRGG